MARLTRIGPLLLVLGACSREGRTVDPEQPQTPPISASDPREPAFQNNVYQVSQGGRYFTWYGCGACHAAGARGALDLGDANWRHGGSVDRVYAAIARGHRPRYDYGTLIPVEQLWQITAFVRDLPYHTRGKRQRQDVDLQGEPQGQTWAGALR